MPERTDSAISLGGEARPGTPPWRADVEALFALLHESRPSGPSRSRIMAIVEAEAGGALTKAAIRAIADRVAGEL